MPRKQKLTGSSEYLLDAIWYCICAIMIGMPTLSFEALRSFQSIIARASLVEDLVAHLAATAVLLCEAQIAAAIYNGTIEKRGPFRLFRLSIYIICISVMVLSLHFFGWMEWYYTRFLANDSADLTLHDKDGKIYDAFNDVDAFAWALNLLGAVLVLWFAVFLKLRAHKEGVDKLNSVSHSGTKNPYPKLVLTWQPTTYLISISAVHIVIRIWDVYVKANSISLLHFTDGTLQDLSSWDIHGLVIVDAFLHGWLTFVNLILLFVLLVKGRSGAWSARSEEVLEDSNKYAHPQNGGPPIPAKAVVRVEHVESESERTRAV